MKQTERALPQRMISMSWLLINVRGGEPLPPRRGVDSEGTASGSQKNSDIARCFSDSCAGSFDGLLYRERCEGRSEKCFGGCFEASSRECHT